MAKGASRTDLGPGSLVTAMVRLPLAGAGRLGAGSHAR